MSGPLGTVVETLPGVLDGIKVGIEVAVINEILVALGRI
jgi:hypothetical protein